MNKSEHQIRGVLMRLVDDDEKRIDLSFRGELTDDSQNRSLAEVLDESSDFYFDMSDRWKGAMLTTLNDPIYPKPAKTRPVRALHNVASFMRQRSQGNVMGDQRKLVRERNCEEYSSHIMTMEQ
jgi:hypothetical protein